MLKKDVRYAPGRNVALDVIAPTAASRRCAVLVLHGGAWRMGARQLMYDRAAAIAAQGFTAIPVSYRLVDAAPWPAQLDDVVAAIDWVRSHAAEIGVDADRIVVQGHSAGAHLALLSGTLPAGKRPAAIVAYYPPFGFYRTAPPAPGAPPGMPQLGPEHRLAHWMLLAPNADDNAIRAASPADVIGPGFPPTILFQGDADIAIPWQSAVALHQKLQAAGAPTELHLYASCNHEFDMAPSWTATCVTALSTFLERNVIDKAAAKAELARFPFPPAAPGH